MKHKLNLSVSLLIAMLAATIHADLMNGDVTINVDEGNTSQLLLHTGTGVVEKTGSGILTLQNPGLFNGTIRLQEGAIAVEQTALAPAARPDAVFTRAAFHVDASNPDSLTLNQDGTVAQWRDTRGAGYPYAYPPAIPPVLAETALNGLPVVDFGNMAFYTGRDLSMYWSQEFTNSVKSAFWVLGSQFGGGFLLGASSTYHLHRGIVGTRYPMNYIDPNAPVHRTGNTAAFVVNGTTRIDQQTRDGRTTGLSGAFHLISLVTDPANDNSLTVGRFANDRTKTGQSGGQSLAEVIIFEEHLTEQDVESIEAYLRDKWFPSAELRVVELDGSGTITPEPDTTLRINLLTGTGDLELNDPTLIDGINMAGNIHLSGTGPVEVGLLRGTGTFTSSYTVDLLNLGLYYTDLTLDAPVTDNCINTLYGEGGLELTDDIAFGEVLLGDNITITNNNTDLYIDLLSGRGTLDTAACGDLYINNLTSVLDGANTINSGTNPIFVENMTVSTVTAWLITSSDIEIDILSGDGTVRLQNAASVTINDATDFTGTLYLDNCGEVEVLAPANKVWTKMQIVGTTSLTMPTGNLIITELNARDTLTLANTLVVNKLQMPANLTLTYPGSDPLIMNEIVGPGTLTTTHPYYASVINLSGSQQVDIGYSNEVSLVTGTGTLNTPAVPFTIGTLRANGSIIFNNSANPLSIGQVTGSGGTLTTGNSATTIDELTLTDLERATIDAGTAPLTITKLTGHGALRKNGSGTFTLPVPTTMRTITVESGTINPVRVSPATLPPTLNPDFWLDASLADTLKLDSEGRITEWWDVRKESTEDEWMHAYSSSTAAAPTIRHASANGLPVVDMGVYEGGKFLRWSKKINPVRTFFMALGTHEGGGYVLGNSAKNDFIRGPKPKTYKIYLWNAEKVYTRLGRSYVDSELTPQSKETPFNGGYQVFSFIDDTDESNNPTLQRGAADQFGRYMTDNTSYSGGQRLGEVIILDRVVTEAERAAVESYLTAKWIADIRRLELLSDASLTLNSSDSLSIDLACGSGTLSKDGSGDLKVSNAALLAGGLHINQGKLLFARTERSLAVNPNFHVDASAPDSLQTDNYGYVTNWSDVRLTGTNAYTDDPVYEAPNLLLNALNGKPMVDFNFYGAGGRSPAPYAQYNSDHNRQLRFTSEITNIRSVFWLYGSQNGGGFLLGHTGTKYHFHRGAGTYGDSTAPALINTDAATAVQNGRFYVDGKSLSSGFEANVLNGDYQLIQLVMDADAASDCFSRDRNFNAQRGGQRLGEVVIFDYTLAEKERMNMEALISAKWFGDLRHVSLADGATLDTGSADSPVVVATLTGSGTVQRTGNAPMRLIDGSSFSGTLETHLDKLLLAHKETPLQPAPNPSLWIDPSRSGGVTLSGSEVTAIKDFSANDIEFELLGGNPTILLDQLNGLPVIDLGPCISGGKALKFDGTKAPMRSFVAVHGSQAGGGCFIGQSSGYPFYREWSSSDGTKNPFTPIWHSSASDSNVRRGWTYIDGQNLCGVRRGFTGGYSTFSLITTRRATPFTDHIYIAGDRTNPRGGVRLGEVLFYDRILSDTERQQTEAYLNSKWFGRASTGYAAPKSPTLAHIHSLGGTLQVAAGEMAVVGNITGSESIAVNGGGKLVLTSGSSDTPASYQVANGSLTLTPTEPLYAELPVTTDLAFWVDASQLDTITLSPGTTTEVTKWEDVRGNSYPYAFTTPGSYYINTAVAEENRIEGGQLMAPPTLVRNALKGQPVVDFGSYNSNQWLQWNTPVNGIRTAFWVVKSTAQGGNLMSGLGNINHFIRGSVKLANTAPYLWNGTWSWIDEHESRINGYPVDGRRAGLNGLDYQLLSLRTSTADPSAQAFACDRPGQKDGNSSRCGGIALAEVLIYTRRLTDTERDQVEGYLRQKWFTTGTPNTTYGATTHDGTTVDLDRNSELILDGVDLDDITVTGSGYIANSEIPPTVFQLTGPRTFAQGLVLADGAKLYLDLDSNQLAKSKVSVTGGLTIEGAGTVVVDSVTNWTPGTQSAQLLSYDTITGGANFNTQWEGANAPQGYSLRPIWDDNGNLLQAIFIPSGTLMMLR